MDIAHIYEIYQQQQDRIRRTNRWGKPKILLQLRKRDKGVSEADIQLLISFLADNQKKWFVADLLNTLESFPLELLRPTLTAAVEELDPSFNNRFVKPCRRTVDYLTIQEILLDLFE